MRIRDRIIVILATTILATQALPAWADTSFSGTATDDPLVPVEATGYDLGLVCEGAGLAHPIANPLNAPEVTVAPGVTDNGASPCGKLVEITVVDTARGLTSQSVTARVVDRCAGCRSGDIDLSPAAFDKIAKPSEGRVKVTWKFG